MKKIISFFKKYIFFLGIIIFLVIISKTDLPGLWLNIKEIKPFFLIIALLLDLPIILVKALGWNYIKKQQGIKYSIKNSFLMYFSGVYTGSFTPGKLGEIVKAFYLKNDGHSFGKSLVGVVLDRFTDFIFLLAFIFIGSLFFLNLIHKQVLISVIIIIIAFLLFLLFLKIGAIKYFFKKLFYILVPEKHQKSWQVSFQDFIKDIKIYKFKNYLVIFGITALSWFFYYIQMFILAIGANILSIPFLYFAISMTITGFMVLLPISISGIGTRDITLILLFEQFLIPKEKIIVFSALILLAYLFTMLCGLIAWLIKPIKFQSH